MGRTAPGQLKERLRQYDQPTKVHGWFRCTGWKRELLWALPGAAHGTEEVVTSFLRRRRESHAPPGGTVEVLGGATASLDLEAVDTQSFVVLLDRSLAGECFGCGKKGHVRAKCRTPAPLPGVRRVAALVAEKRDLAQVAATLQKRNAALLKKGAAAATSAAGKRAAKNRPRSPAPPCIVIETHSLKRQRQTHRSLPPETGTATRYR